MPAGDKTSNSRKSEGGSFTMSGSVSLGSTMTAEMKEKIGRLSKIGTELEKLHNKDVKTKTEESSLIREELSTLSEAVSALFAEMNLKFEAQGQAEWAQKMEELKRKIADIIADLDRKMKSREEAEAGLRSEISGLRAALDRVERMSRADDIRSQLAHINGRLDALGAPPDVAAIRNDIKTELAQELADLRDALNGEIADRKAAADPLLDQIAEIRTLAEQMQPKDDNGLPLSALQDQLNGQKDAHRLDMDMLRREILAVRAGSGSDPRLPELEKKLHSLQDRINSALDDHSTQLTKLRNDITIVPSTIQDEVTKKLAPMMDADQKKLNQVNDSIASLRTELMDLVRQALAQLDPIKEELKKLEAADGQLDSKIRNNLDRIEALQRSLGYFKTTYGDDLESLRQKDRDLEAKILSKTDDHLYEKINLLQKELELKISDLKNALSSGISTERLRREDGLKLLDDNVQLLINLFSAIGKDINGAGLSGRRRLSVSTPTRESPVKRQKKAVDDSKCTHCGNVFMPDAVYCRNCGAPRGKTPLQVAEENGQQLREQFGKEFEKYDSQKTGKVPLKQLQKLVHKGDAAKTKLFVDNIGTDGNGNVSGAEFIAYRTYEQMDKDKAFWALFNEIDTDRSGTLDKEEILDHKWTNPEKHFIQMMGIDSWKDATSKIAKDGAKVTRQQFIDHMKSVPVKFRQKV
eukprot:TRINITY_DN4702_c0_g1_i1.p1 TRINITY_DN4702_c0_g1~~TRINITY_DN4702_c0_g1_i1.p1  ORF type:complete len:695 (-),score=215.29 TRINITY_DN4702_c0_g1_i1:140-2224(-)